MADYLVAAKHVDWLVGAKHLKALGDLAANIFTCGGTLDAHPEVRVTYRNETKSWSEATFPALQEAAVFPQIRSVGFDLISYFPRGEDLMTEFPTRGFPVADKSNRIDPKEFFTSFQLSATSILNEVHLLLTPAISDIRAKLYKMNIYTASTGGIEAHVANPGLHTGHLAYIPLSSLVL